MVPEENTTVPLYTELNILPFLAFCFDFSRKIQNYTSGANEAEVEF